MCIHIFFIILIIVIINTLIDYIWTTRILMHGNFSVERLHFQTKYN